MRESPGQGFADSVPVSSLLSPATQCVSATFRFSQRLSAEVALCFQLLADSFSLFALICALPSFVFNSLPTLLRKCRGGVGWASRSGLWTLGGSRRRLPVPEMLTGYPGWHIPHNVSALASRRCLMRSPTCSLGDLWPLLYLPLESTLAKVYQNKRLQLPLESPLMQKREGGGDYC